MNKRTLSNSAMSVVALLLGTSLSLSAARTQASELDPESVERLETVSVGGGMLAGALVGGPPGAIAGALAGVLAGDRILVGRKNRALQASLDTTRDELLALQQANQNLQQQLAAEQSRAREQIASLSHQVAANACCGDGQMVIHFRTGSSEVEELYRQDLQNFVAYVKSVPDAVVEMYGYADRRGEDTDNLWLSQERVQKVEEELRQLGLRDFTYETTALGENQPQLADESIEGNFFDRRVVLRVRSGDNEYLSSRR